MQIDINNLCFAYMHKLVINNLSLSLNTGDFLVIRGKNGSGKSTLVKCLLGINPVKSGMIFFNHEDIVNFKAWTTIGYVPQKFEDFNYEYPITIKEFLSVSRLKRTKESDVLRLLDKMGILEIQNDNINSLSGGQLQRVFIVRAMLNNPKLLILDEPTASIDKRNVMYFRETVNQLHSEGVTVILISHDESMANLNYTHVLTMSSDFSFTFQSRKNAELTPGVNE